MANVRSCCCRIPTRSISTNLIRGRVVSLLEPETNQLVALDIEREGMTLWTVGGETSFDDTLREAYFLGSPLPIDDQLFAIAQIKDEIRLLCIDSTEGTLRWSQQLAQVESTVNWSNIRRRQLAGATPSYANGILICPTSAGVILAVEPASRTLLWAYTYDDTPARSGSHRIPFGNHLRQQSVKPGEHWSDAAPIIEDGCVIFTPTEIDKLVCLDLATGKPKWRNKKREDMMYVAGAKDGTIVCMKSDGVRGIKLSDGKLRWPDVKLKKGEVVTGRGFMNGDAYYFPTSHSDVIKLDMRTGRIQERQPTDRVLGNLVCHRDYLISQSIDGIYAYPIESRKRAALQEQVKADPNNPDVLHDYAVLQFEDGNIRQSLETMQKAIELSETPAKRDHQLALAELIQQAMTQNFSAESELPEIFLGLDPPAGMRLQFFKSRARGFLELGNQDEALTNLLRAIDVTMQLSSDEQSKPSPVQDNSFWRVSNPTELSLLLQELLETDAQVPEQLARSIGRTLPEASRNESHLWMELLSGSRKRSPALQRLYEIATVRFAGQAALDDPVACSVALHSMLATIPKDNAESDQHAAEAFIQLASLYSSQGDYQTAAHRYDQAQQQFAGLRCERRNGF